MVLPLCVTDMQHELQVYICMQTPWWLRVEKNSLCNFCVDAYRFLWCFKNRFWVHVSSLFLLYGKSEAHALLVELILSRSFACLFLFLVSVY